MPSDIEKSSMLLEDPAKVFFLQIFGRATLRSSPGGEPLSQAYLSRDVMEAATLVRFEPVDVPTYRF